MSSDLAVRPDFTATGLVLPEEMAFDDWAALGGQLRLFVKASLWWWGDWLLFGERKYGEMYSQALEVSDHAYQSLANAVFVSSKIEFYRRRENLSWAHHQEVASLPQVEQDEWLERAECESLSRNELRRALSIRHIPSAKITAPPGNYCTIVADPPWQYDNTSTRAAAENHYPTMSIQQIAELPVKDWTTDQAHLYLWTTNGFLREAFEIVDAWGFEYKTLLTWVKKQIGIGNYFRPRTEHVLFAVKGGLRTNLRDQSNVIEAKRERHSKKPGAFYDLVEKMSPSPALEMFARERRMSSTGDFEWHYWGNEA